MCNNKLNAYLFIYLSLLLGVRGHREPNSGVSKMSRMNPSWTDIVRSFEKLLELLANQIELQERLDVAAGRCPCMDEVVVAHQAPLELEQQSTLEHSQQQQMRGDATFSLAQQPQQNQQQIQQLQQHIQEQMLQQEQQLQQLQQQQYLQQQQHPQHQEQQQQQYQQNQQWQLQQHMPQLASSMIESADQDAMFFPDTTNVSAIAMDSSDVGFCVILFNGYLLKRYCYPFCRKKLSRFVTTHPMTSHSSFPRVRPMSRQTMLTSESFAT